MNTRKKPDNSIYRAKKTTEFVGNRIIDKITPILDIGEPNYLGKYISYNILQPIINTNCDLDYDLNIDTNIKIRTVFCFEVLEHILNPRTFLDNIYNKTEKDVQLFLSTPQRPKFLWNNEEHFHEYDKDRLNYLLNKTGWKIICHKRIRLINNKTDWFKYIKGIRPLFRIFYDYTEIYELRKICLN